MNLPLIPSNPELNIVGPSCTLEASNWPFIWEAIVLDRETVEKVSKLARLKLNDDEVAVFAEQLSHVLANFEMIAQVDTSGVRPLVTPTDMSVHLRGDDTTLGGCHPASETETEAETEAENEKLLANAPEKTGRLFKVPPVV